MQLSELKAYAKDQYQIMEDPKWASFPGYSVLVEPETGKWVALLMPSRRDEAGREIACCDLRCGRSALSEARSTYLSVPLRMRGANWLGVKFNEATERELVLSLFDKAVADLRGGARGHMMVLADEGVGGGVSESEGRGSRPQGELIGDTPIRIDGVRSATQIEGLPERIREMLSIYEYGNGSFVDKCRNFVRQGQLMAGYTDDKPYHQPYKHYFPTYHDLNLRQLRGYFTWRTKVREGEWLFAPRSFAYIYIYELLNGIGVGSAEESIAQMEVARDKLRESGIGDERMERNIERWMLELCILKGLPQALALGYLDPAIAGRDEALTVLRSPEAHSDLRVYSALCLLAGKREDFSPAVRKHGDEARRLFAEVWRAGDHFASCFGQMSWGLWRPLANAIYYETEARPEGEYTLSESRRYRYEGGEWQEGSYEPLRFDRRRLQVLLRATDRLLRQYLRAGGTLTARDDEAWAVPYIDAVINADRLARQEAARPKVTINLAGLEQIRSDASVTRESLLTDEERSEGAQPEGGEGAGKTAPEPRVARGEESLSWQILRLLLSGESVTELIARERLMPSIIADSINEELFDAIGDSVVESDGTTLQLVEDYRQDIQQLIDRH